MGMKPETKRAYNQAKKDWQQEEGYWNLIKAIATIKYKPIYGPPVPKEPEIKLQITGTFLYHMKRDWKRMGYVDIDGQWVKP